ncbi:putative TFIIIC transcription initiation factor complex subunits Tfc3 [Aspergillus stella-maris]|uniref:putative TFIIIC transcription initiation factor complex subunits Tfc3 n=1 Tax=Aspergillus stella-maris TaxID=1810926 RepID=UPI003CCD9458
MAPSFRDLIDFLLAEIALCGSQGASPADILSFIDAFYTKHATNDSDRSHVVDRRFKEKVWQWITKNPEVSVGTEREGNALTLEEVEKRAQEKPNELLNVFVSEERTWLAITGHEPDETKILQMEFALLSIIASRKSAGISQPELIKLSGQDKRSVPKRTDILQQKGYIEKRAIQMKAVRTSLCTLRKFLTPVATDTGATEAGSRLGAVPMVDFTQFTNRLFDILREHKIISRNDLKSLLGFKDRWHWKILSRTVRKFERIGVMKRVKAMSQYATTMRSYHPCIMLVREPTEQDIEAFHDFTKSMYTDMDKGGDADFEDEGEAEDSRELSASGDVAVERQEGVEASGRVLPVWTPDRCIHNQVFDVVDRTETSGSTNSDVLRACIGVFWRRPMENTLARLSECWQLSQPPHLRHLAILRDTALNRTITHYVHYSFQNFSSLVEAGEASWEAVQFVPRNSKSDNLRILPVDAKPQLDNYGLPVETPDSGLLKRGDCTLSDCMWVVKPKDYNCSSSDPKAVKSEGGGYTVDYGIKSKPAPSPAKKRASPAPSARVKFEDEAVPTVDLESAPTPAPKRPPKKKYDAEKFAGMSQKEKFEAMGMDETWTEYSVLLIERPSPGVYVTSRGRRRPAGKERGRPPVSRIAVFKSPKLLDFPWFEKEKSDSRAPSPRPQTVENLPRTAAETLADSNGVQEESSERGTKRPSGRRSPDAVADVSQKAAKIRRTEAAANGVASAPVEPAADGITDGSQTAEVQTHEPQSTPRGRGKRKRAVSPDTTKNGKSLKVEKQPQPVPKEDTSQSQTANGTSMDQSAVPETPQVDDTPRAVEDPTTAKEPSTAVTSTATPVMEPPSTPAHPLNDTPASQISLTPETFTKKVIRSKHQEKGGSVAFLRRKIVMDVVEQAGGAYPMGTDLWYPFMTAWMKTKYKEKPDMRTLRTTVKHLVDAGKLRQQTFCGKDSKGVMVTKTIICKAELSPDDRFVKDMQQKMLASDTRHYFPPGVEIEANLTKQGITPKIPKGVKYTNTPIESSMTVKLRSKPAAVAAMEKRKGETVQRQLLRQLEIEQMRESMQEVLPSGVVRLLSIPRNRNQAHRTPYPLGDGAPYTHLNYRGARRGRAPGSIVSRQVKRSRFPLSLVVPYAMLMTPIQSFNPVTGTFSTNARLSAIRPKLPAPRLTPASLMMMTPLQSFNPTTGTFSTDGGISAFVAAKRLQHRMSMSQKQAHLPHSIDDLFTQARRRRTAHALGETDPRSKEFMRDTNTIMRWELQNERFLHREKSANLRYINQGIGDAFESAPIEGGIRFNATNFTPDPTVRTRRRSRQEQSELQELQDRSSPEFVFTEHPPIPPRPLSPELEPVNPLDAPLFETHVSSLHAPYFFEAPAPQPARLRRVEKLNELMAAGNDSTAPTPGKVPLRRRGPPLPLSHSSHQNLMTAIVAVRALAGGTDGRQVDWILVGCCFPGQDQNMVIDKGKGILARNRLQIAKMQSDFQERFIEAYANNEVPRIDYTNLEAYDWGAVIEWANAELDVPKLDRPPGLPATREQFDHIFELREETPVSLDEYYQPSGVTQNRKRNLLANVPFAVPLSLSSSKRQSQRKSQLSHFDTVKTWVRANITTPAEVYRASDARDALSRFNGGVLNNALQSLVTERVISQANKGRVVPGRNYDITDHFIHTLSKRRPIEATELRRASKFKTNTLDPALTSKGVYSVRFDAEDGDILAIINLFFSGHVTLKPRDAPRDKFGLTEGGYLTRMMNKDKLRFPIDVYPVKSKYGTGNTIAETASSRPPPCPPRIPVSISTGPPLSLPERFPLWIDIHGNFISILWELSLAAVLGTVAMRPGISAGKTAGMIRPTLAGWEVELVLEWLCGAGVMDRRGGGANHGPDTDVESESESGSGSAWFVREWWWMVLS